MHLIPQSWAHWHILLGVVPMVGLVFLLGFHATAMATGNAFMQRCCLAVFIILALLAIPIYASGDGAAAALSGNPRLAADLLAGHRGRGLAALVALAATGIAAAIALRSGRPKGFSGAELGLVFGLGLLTLVLTIFVAIDSWQINHLELRTEATDQRTPQTWSHVHIILNHFP